MMESAEGKVEQEARETVGRSQNVVYIVPQDWADVGLILGSMLERIETSAAGPQVLVITPDAETAATAAEAILRGDATTHPRAVAATSPRRTARVLAAGGVQVIAGAPRELVELMQGAQLKLEQVRGVALAWLENLSEEDAGTLATIMGDVPKDAARTIAAAAATPEVEALVERYARRARRVVAPAPPELPAMDLGYVTVSAHARAATLRRLLDHLDPATAVVVARHPQSIEAAKHVLQALGSHGDGAPMRVARRAEGQVDLVVMYDLPDSRALLHEWTGGAALSVVAIVQPRQLDSLRQLAGGGAVTPVTLPEAARRAQRHEDALRAELRSVLEQGAVSREVLALETLLEDYDGVEIAAAALQLLEQARARSAAAAAAPPTDRRATGAMTRLFVSAGARDNLRPGDLVGAITNEAAITSAQVGKVDVRDSHSLVEVAADVAERVVAALSGVMIRGRRIAARLDRERPPRNSGGRGGESSRGRPTGARGPRRTVHGRPTTRGDEE